MIFLLAVSRASVCLHEDDVFFSFVAKLIIHFEVFMYVDSGKHKKEDLSSSPPLPWEHYIPSHLCVQGQYQPHPAIHENFSTKEQILSTPSLQLFSLPQVSHPLKTVLHYSFSHANVNAVSILVI